ncbi:MAG: hypothetical protein HC801_06530 [Nitrospira sp.]|nr:hypothetical protein [Nitrospira sp.]
MPTTWPTAQTLIEDAVIEILLQSGPCTMDEVTAALPHLNWSELFSAVDDMSRDGRVVLRLLAGSGYQLSVPAAAPRIAAGGQRRPQVRFCGGCGYLRDEVQPDHGLVQWVEARHYLKKYGVTWNELDRHDTICPACARVIACGRRRLPSHAAATTAAH